MLMAEYLCPVHGRFEVLVERDENGDAPDVVVCNADFYLVKQPHTGEVMRREGGARCDRPATWIISAPQPKALSVPCSAAVRGGDTERRPGMLDTRPLAEGMPMSEWRKIQKGHQEERRHHQLIKKGLKQKRIQSP
jgi:hypothetical protein